MFAHIKLFRLVLIVPLAFHVPTISKIRVRVTKLPASLEHSAELK